MSVGAKHAYSQLTTTVWLAFHLLHWLSAVASQICGAQLAAWLHLRLETCWQQTQQHFDLIGKPFQSLCWQETFVTHRRFNSNQGSHQSVLHKTNSIYAQLSLHTLLSKHALSAQSYSLQKLFDNEHNAPPPCACIPLISRHACCSVQSALCSSHICDKWAFEPCHTTKTWTLYSFGDQQEWHCDCPEMQANNCVCKARVLHSCLAAYLRRSCVLFTACCNGCSLHSRSCHSSM